MTGLLAHGLVQRANLPIPEWLFFWAAAVVLVVSFVALALLWSAPAARARPLAAAAAAWPRARDRERSRSLLGALGFAAARGDDRRRLHRAAGRAVELHAGLRPDHLLGRDGVRQRAVRRHLPRAEPVARRRPRAVRPARGRAPVPGAGSAGGRRRSGLLIFTWIELASGWGEHPARLATAAVVYSVLTLDRRWRSTASRPGRAAARRSRSTSTCSRASRSSRSAARVVGVRPPLGGLPSLERPPGTVAFVVVMIGTVTFDGLSQGAIWKDISTSLFDTLGATLTSTIGLLLGVGLVGGFYLLGMAGARTVGGGFDTRTLARAVRALAGPDRARLRRRPLPDVPASSRARRSATRPRIRSARAGTCSAGPTPGSTTA